VKLGQSCAAFGGLALAAQVTASCIFDPILEGLPCPCQEGWHCDPFSETCVADTCEPRVFVKDLAASWAAPHSIYWTWSLEGAASDFLKYELVLAENEEDLKTRTGTAKVYDASNNPELGVYEIPYSDAVVDSTVTRELAPLTSYLALLYVTDVNRCESSTMIFEKKTAPATLSEIVVVGEGPEPPGSRARPDPGASFEPVGDSFRIHYDGEVDTGCLEPPAGQESRPTCGQPVGIDGLSLDVTSANPGINAAGFNDAYLEVEVEVVDSPTPLWFGWIRFLTNSCGEQDRYSFASPEMVVPNINGKRTLLEAPFNQLSNYREVGEDEGVSTPFEFSTIAPASGGTPICGINVGGQKHKDGDLVIHKARIVF
jgi:hypothetical protein